MIIRRILGIILIALPIYPVCVSIWLVWDTNERFQKAQDEILLSSLAIKTGETAEFEVTYPDAHGIWIMNAVISEDENSKEVILLVDAWDYHAPLPFIYQEGEKGLIPGHSFEKPVKVTKLSDLQEDIQFKNMVCGCENLGPHFLLMIVLGLGALFWGVGLLLILKKPKKPKITSPEGDAPDSPGTP